MNLRISLRHSQVCRVTLPLRGRHPTGENPEAHQVHYRIFESVRSLKNGCVS